jgi:Ca2+-binding RTX toxin-like protein
LNANGGDDSFSCTGNLAALIQITADGGPGNDTLLGGNGADVLIGGDDNDFIDGNQGNDVVFLGVGDDTFQWDPGDGNDTVEGQAGNDRLIFNGSNIAEIIDLSANGSRLRLTRNVANIVMDVNGVERADLNLLGGADIITVNDLTGTGVSQVNLELAGTLGGSTGDAASDIVTVNGTGSADTISVTANAGAVSVSGLAALVQILHPEAALDSLVVNGLAGTDLFSLGAGVTALIGVTLNQ